MTIPHSHFSFYICRLDWWRFFHRHGSRRLSTTWDHNGSHALREMQSRIGSSGNVLGWGRSCWKTTGADWPSGWRKYLDGLTTISRLRAPAALVYRNQSAPSTHG